MYKLELTEEEIQFLYDRCSRKAQRLEEAGLHDISCYKMKLKFITFRPLWEYRGNCNVCISPEVQINDWLKENPDIEIICWQACPVGDHNELYITIQYRERED